MTKQQSLERRESVTILFAGDSGDGMQLTGTQFTTTSALAGNDLSTFPDFPAAIRAPAGTPAGVSGFLTEGLGMGHVMLTLPDRRLAEDFFVHVLGFRVTDRMDMGGGKGAGGGEIRGP